MQPWNGKEALGSAGEPAAAGREQEGSDRREGAQLMLTAAIAAAASLDRPHCFASSSMLGCAVSCRRETGAQRGEIKLR